MISYIGANKHHRQRKFVRRSTKQSEVQSTCKMSRGWMMRRELRGEGLVGRVTLATMARSIEGTRTYDGFQILVFRAWFPKWFPKIWFLNQKMVSQNMVSQSKNGFPKYGFSIKKWFPKIWFLNQKMVSQNMVSQSKNGFPKYGFSIKIW